MFRAWARSRAMACSAADRMFDCGAFTTMTPRRVAASTSTLSRPMPARPTTARSVPAARASAVTWVADRTMRARAPGSVWIKACGLSSSWTSTWCPASARRARPRSANFSVTSTRAIVRLPVLSHGRPLLGGGEQLGQAGHTFGDVVVAQRVGHAEVPGGPEGLTRHHRHLGLVDGHLGDLVRRRDQLTGDAASEQSLHRREGVEGALGLDTGHALALVEHAVDQLAPAVEDLAH